MLSNPNSDALRSLSTIFTPAHFRKIVSDGDIAPSIKKITRYYGNVQSHSFRFLIRKLYRQLRTHYRNEYVFKNTLLYSELLEKYGLADTTMLDEVRVGSSIADFVLLNGEIRIFEIKTDLDGLDKLGKQVEDYRRIADKIYVVAGFRTLDRVYAKYRSSDLGIIVFDREGNLGTIKEAIPQTRFLDHLSLFKLLRQPEYYSLICDYFGRQPLFPNTRVFSECLQLAKLIDVTEFQSLVRDKLKLRNLRCPEMLSSPKTPFELKHICHSLNLSKSEYGNLYAVLGRRV